MNKPHLTAIKRNKLSAPTRWLVENHKISKGYLLDYGCGRGDDVRFINEMASLHVHAYGWDLYHNHDERWFCDNIHNHWWQTVICNYVLNVIPLGEQAMVIEDLLSLDARDIFATVRRDLKENYETKRGTQQYLVELDYPVVKKTPGFCIYRLR